MTIRMKTVNGNQIRDYSHMDLTPARRFAADIPTGHDAINMIETAAGESGVCVKLSTDFNDDSVSLTVPDGWELDHFNVVSDGPVVSDGAVYAYIEEVDA